MKKFHIILLLLITLTITVGANPYSFNLYDLPTFDNNTAFVNGSENWVTKSLGSLDDANPTQFNAVAKSLTIDESWVTSMWCRLTGCTMSGDIDMDSNSILSAEDVNADNGIFTNTLTNNINNIANNDRIDVENSILFSDGSQESIDWENRDLLDITEVLSTNWQNRILYSIEAGGNPQPSLDWESKVAYIGDGTTVVLSWDARALYDDTGDLSVDWENRALYEDDGGDIILDYSTEDLANFNDNEIKTSNFLRLVGNENVGGIRLGDVGGGNPALEIEFDSGNNLVQIDGLSGDDMRMSSGKFIFNALDNSPNGLVEFQHKSTKMFWFNVNRDNDQVVNFIDKDADLNFIFGSERNFNRNFDKQRTVSTGDDPYFYLPSGTDWNSDNTQYFRFYHNKTNTYLDSGKGIVVINDSLDVVGDLDVTNNFTAQEGYIVNPVYYNVTNATVQSGTLDGGDLNSLSNCMDDDWYNVSEPSGSPATKISMEFTNVVSFRRVLACVDYMAVGGGHIMDLKVFNDDLSTNISLREIPPTGNMNCNYFGIDDDDALINATGSVMFHFGHDDTGIPSHDVGIGCMRLER